MDLKKDGTNFTDEQGKFNVKKLLAASPKVLSRFINRKKADDSEGDNNSGYSNTATATLNVLAAIAAADQRPHHVPLNSKDAVHTLANAAARNLDLSATAGLGMAPGRSSFPDHQSAGINPDYAKKGTSGNNNADKKDKGPKG